MFVRLPMQTSASPHSTQRLASRPVFLPCTPRQPVPERARCSTLSRSFQSDAIGSHDQSRWWPSEETPFRQPRQQQFLQQQFPQQAPQQQTETEFLWAGYSDLSEQLRQLHARHENMVSQVKTLEAKLQTMQQQPPAGAWQAAAFLLFFMAFINFVGLLTTFNPWLFLPWMAKSPAVQSTMYVKQVLGVVLPMTNTLVVIIFCLQAVRAAWACLKW